MKLPKYSFLVLFVLCFTFFVPYVGAISVDCTQSNILDPAGVCCCWIPDPTGGHAWGHVMDLGTVISNSDVYFEIEPGCGDGGCSSTGYMYYSLDGTTWTLFWSQPNLAGWTTYSGNAHIADSFRYIRANTDSCSVDWSLVTVNPSTNQPPVASFEYTPLNPSIIDTIKFKSTSTDPDNDQLTYNWEFRDIPTSTLIFTSTLMEVDYKFTKVGRYNIKLTVKDPTNAPVFTDKTISVVCGGPNPISAAVVRGANLDNYGCRKIPFTSESGEIINICWPLDRFIMVYYGPICGNGIDVGRCEFVHGSNLETITYVDNNNNGKPDCFLSTNWRNRDYGEDDNGDGKLDWYVFDFNANTCTLSTTHRLFEYPYPCGGNLPACVVWDQDTWKLACNQKSTKSLPICNRQYIYKKPEGPVIL